MAGCDPHPVRRPGAARAGPDGAPVPLALRSSPGPKTGCSLPTSACCSSRSSGCDPHPVRRPGAASAGRKVTWSSVGCDPHPVRRPGAAPAPRASRCTVLPLRSSPGPKTGCSVRRPPDRRPGCRVAILTRSEDRVQLWTRHGVCRVRRGCDPHPVRRPGAAPSANGWTAGATAWLRSSPGPKTGCSVIPPPRSPPGPRVAILTRSEDRVQLRRWREADPADGPLRSSPGPKTGCSAWGAAGKYWAVRVAILTRSEDRVQLGLIDANCRAPKLRSSPGPKTGCSAPSRIACAPARVLRSSPGPKTGCSVRPYGLTPAQLRLRSSPGPKTGCSARQRGLHLPG